MSKPHKTSQKSIRKMRLASIGALIVALCLLGSMLLVRILLVAIERDVKERMSFDIELPNNYELESYQELESEFAKIKGIRSTDYISADSALNYIRQEIGEDPSKVLGYNPFTPRVQVRVLADYMHQDSLLNIQKQLGELGLDVEGFETQQTEQLSVINRNMSRIEWVLLILLVLQGLFTYGQINNTTRLMIYAERLQIRTLTLIGASSWFVRRPIVLRSICDGVIAAVISFVLLAVIVAVLEFGQSLNILTMLPPIYLYGSALIVLAVSILATGLASLRATWMYINMDGRRIHLI